MPQATDETQQMGRPPYQPTDAVRANVRRLSRIGMRHSDIALIVRICKATLQQHYMQELLEGAAEGTEQVMETLYTMATDGQHQAATIFSTKMRCNMKASPDDTPPPAEEPQETDPDKISQALLAKFEAIVEANGHYVFPHQRAAAEAEAEAAAAKLAALESDPGAEPSEPKPEIASEPAPEPAPPEPPASLCENPYCLAHHPQPEPPPLDDELDMDSEPSPPGEHITEPQYGDL